MAGAKGTDDDKFMMPPDGGTGGLLPAGGRATGLLADVYNSYSINLFGVKRWNMSGACVPIQLLIGTHAIAMRHCVSS